MHYFHDSSTEEGWSGAPVIDNVSGLVVGVHVGATMWNGKTHNHAVDVQLLDLNGKPTGVAQHQ
jgi:V8-like Glu-specific endopeptidase